MLFFFHRLSIGLVLNRRILAAAALYETYNIPIVKKYNQFIAFFSEHKLYGFPQSEVKPHSSPCFSTGSAAAIVHRNHFFRLHQKDKSESKVKFRQASNHCKSLLEAVKLVYANKTKEFTTS